MPNETTEQKPVVKKFSFFSSRGVRRGTFYATNIDYNDGTVGVFNGIDLIGVVRLAEGEILAVVTD